MKQENGVFSRRREVLDLVASTWGVCRSNEIPLALCVSSIILYLYIVSHVALAMPFLSYTECSQVGVWNSHSFKLLYDRVQMVWIQICALHCCCKFRYTTLHCISLSLNGMSFLIQPTYGDDIHVALKDKVFHVFSAASNFFLTILDILFVQRLYNLFIIRSKH